MTIYSSPVDSRLNDKTVFFVIGIPHSGTTCLQRLLNSHPDISCRGEDDFSELAMLLSSLMNMYNQKSLRRNTQKEKSRYCEFVQEDFRPMLSALVEQLLGRAAEEEGVSCIGSKFLNFLEDTTAYDQLTPGSRYIHILRDPRELMVSSYYVRLERTPETMKQFGDSLANYIAYAIPGYLKQIVSYIDFAETAGDRLLTIRHRDIHSHPEQTLGAAYRFLGVDDSAGLVAGAIGISRFKSESEPPSGLDERSIHLRKGILGDWRSTFDDDCRTLIASSPVQEVLEEFGFDPD